MHRRLHTLQDTCQWQVSVHGKQKCSKAENGNMQTDNARYKDARIGAGGYRNDLLDLDPTKGKGLPSGPNGVPGTGAGMFSN